MTINNKKNNKIIMLDPGHSGDDFGAIYNNINEKDINLIIASLIYSQLSNYNYSVYMTRYMDEYLSLNHRCKIANSINSTLFVSIHHNASKIVSANGFEIIYYTNSNDGKILSNIILNELEKNINLNNRGLKERSNLYVLKNTKMPSCLIECGFMSNKNELKYLLNPENQIKISNSITNGIITYLNKDN